MSLVVFELTIALLTLGVVVVVGTNGRPLPSRATPRRRRVVGRRRYALARRCGFRYSYQRDALVLRGVGQRWGPVLRLREEHAADVPAPADRAVAGHRSSPAAAGAATAPLGRRPLALAGPLTLPEHTRDERARSVDVVCIPLPRPHRTQRLWQLTAVELDSRFVWVELTRTRGEPPQPRLAARFVRDIGRDLEARGLRLDAIVVRSGGAQRWPQLGTVDGSVRLQRLPPGNQHERLAANMHARILRSFWHDVFAREQLDSLDALRSGLGEWARRRNAKTLTAEPPQPVGGG
ncbi:hypothetical protein Q5424_18755 [Conexibacter sp. JD483]|uniref:hypothetical protein n=1 Tax=unclassified Conexibacter TaxID=2627773 RepID=UPI0027210CE8|nr:MULTISPECIES: hypothetical protein [unclassified Conexibacter]MDO8186364.1 hypothetical protein [Conexibacter sp. CPCC 205706]MDO8199763.1 hypothetical protein [Conexibacter sp. CPCC 205762]MDR9371144.1 hypothetical protein [Conexibacter sp. JD483]